VSGTPSSSLSTSEEVGDAVLVAVALRADVGRRGMEDVHQRGTFDGIDQPVLVRVALYRVEIPVLAPLRVDESLHLQGVGDQVAVGVRVVAIGAQLV
jgi:hypothetical protein